MCPPVDKTGVLPWRDSDVSDVNLEPTTYNPLFDHSTLGRLNEPDQHGDIFTDIFFRLQLVHCLRSIELGTEQGAESALEFQDAVIAEAAALEADGVHAVSAVLARGAGLGKWQNILRGHSAAADVGVCANAAELIADSLRPRALFD